MIHVIASISIKPEHMEEFIKIFKANVPAVLAEEGCLGYEPALDLPTGLPIQQKDEGVVTIVEKWESLEALQAHLQAPHMKAYKEKTEDMVIDLSVKILKPA